MTVHMRDVAAMSDDELTAEVSDLTAKLAQAFREMGPSYDASKITVFEGDAVGKSQMVADGNGRLEALAGERARRKGMGEAAARIAAEQSQLEAVGKRITPLNGTGEPAPEGFKSLAQRITEAEGFGKGFEGTVPFEAKTDFTTSAGWAPQSVRAPRVELYPTEAVSVIDLIPVIPWDQPAYLYMEETTFTNNAVEKAEAAAAGEAALALTERTETMRKIPVFLPATDEQLRYVPAARAYIDGRLNTMLRQRLELQVLVGDGTPPNISGYGDRATNTQAKGADPVFDAVLKGLDLCRTVGFAEPDMLVLHPNDWQGIRLTRTTDGIYIMGNPADSGPKRLFGTLVSTSARQTEGTGLAGAFGEFSALLAGPSVEIKVSDSHGDNFTKGIQAIKAQVYACLAVFRPTAFTEITGI